MFVFIIFFFIYFVGSGGECRRVQSPCLCPCALLLSVTLANINRDALLLFFHFPTSHLHTCGRNGRVYSPFSSRTLGYDKKLNLSITRQLRLGELVTGHDVASSDLIQTDRLLEKKKATDQTGHTCIGKQSDIYTRPPPFLLNCISRVSAIP